MSLKDKLFGSARLLAVNTELKSHQNGTVKSLFNQLFLVCESEEVDFKSICTHEHGHVLEKRNKLKDLADLKPETTGDSINSKAIGLAETAQRKMKEQSIKAEIDNCQSEAGAKLSSYFGINPPESLKLKEILNKINLAEKKSKELESKIQQISAALPWYLQNPKYTAIALLTFILTGYISIKWYNWYYDPYNVQAREHAKDKNERSVAMAKMKKEQADKMEQSKQSAKAEKEIAAKESKNSELLRLNVLTNTFKRIDINNLIFIDKVNLDGFSMELKGKNSKEILNCLATTNYLGLMEILNDIKYAPNDVPTMESIKSAFSTLLENDFKLFIKTPFAIVQEKWIGKIVMGVAFESSKNLQVKVLDEWETDPDGRGFYTNWRIADGITVLTACKRDLLMKRVSSIKVECRNRQRDLNKKVQLGELSDESVVPVIEKFLTQQVEELQNWLKGQ